MPKLDDAFTTGTYNKVITCSEANGFEVWKTYSIVIQAIVAGDIGGII